MNDTEIHLIIANLSSDLLNKFAVKYQPPIAPGSNHSVELENRNYLGTISIWAAGSMDWHIFKIATSTESLVGHCEVKDISDVKEVLLAIFEKLQSCSA